MKKFRHTSMNEGNQVSEGIVTLEYTTFYAEADFHSEFHRRAAGLKMNFCDEVVIISGTIKIFP